MHHLKISLIAFYLVLFLSKANAGAVSGGGGGTTNPRGVVPADISILVRTYAKTAVHTWWNKQQIDYHDLLKVERGHSLFHPLFQTPPDLSMLLKNVTIELRMNAPCFDPNGQPMDGSVDPATPDRICLSPFSMAPKLSPVNVFQETMALIIHEVAHLLGADEARATEIQWQALLNLHKKNVKAMIDGSRWEINSSTPFLRSLLNRGNRWVNEKDRPEYQVFDRWNFDYEDLMRGLIHGAPVAEPERDFSYLSWTTEKWHEAYWAKRSSVLSTLCLPSFPGGENDCSKHLDLAFRGQSQVSARNFFLNTVYQCNVACQEGLAENSFYDEILVKRINSEQIFFEELEELVKQLALTNSEYEAILTEQFKVQ